MFTTNVLVTLMVTPFAISLLNAAEEQVVDEVSLSDSDDPSLEEEQRTWEIEQLSAGILLGIAYASTAGGLATLTGSIPNQVLLGMSQIPGHVTYHDWFIFALPTAVVSLLLAFAVVYWRFVHSLSLKKFSREVLESELAELECKQGTCSHDEVWVGLIQVLQFLLLLGRPWISRHYTAPLGQMLIGDACLAMLPATFLFLIPSQVTPGQPLLTWRAVHEKLDFGLVLLIGGGFAIASGFVQSGLNIVAGDAIAAVLMHENQLYVTFMIILLASVATQVFSTVGTATVLLPILNSAAARYLHHPLSVLLPATVACSFAYALPTASPSNVVVLAKSNELKRHLRVRDFIFTGLPLNFLVVMVGTALVYTLSTEVFHTDDPFPPWACDQVTALWVNVSGVVRGHAVSSQACSADNSSLRTCMLRNGTHIDVGEFFMDNLVQ